jgi:opacity protein-like surface antigen
MGMASGSGKYTLGESKTSYNSLSMSVKFGMIVQNDYRFELSYETEQHKFKNQEDKDKVSGFNFDFNFAYPKDKIADVVTPYWTLGLGYYTYEDTAHKYKFEDNKDLTGAAFNFGIGGLYEINKNIELEASYKFKKIYWQDIIRDRTTISSDSAGSLFYLGLNYKL